MLKKDNSLLVREISNSSESLYAVVWSPRFNSLTTETLADYINYNIRAYLENGKASCALIGIFQDTESAQADIRYLQRRLETLNTTSQTNSPINQERGF